MMRDSDEPLDAAVDFERLRTVTGGDVELVRELVDTYVEDTEQRMCRLDQAIQSGVAAEVRIEAHSIKGASANMGADAVRDIAFRIEQMGAQESLDEASSALGQLRARFAVARDLFEKYADSEGKPGA